MPPALAVLLSLSLSTGCPAAPEAGPDGSSPSGFEGEARERLVSLLRGTRDAWVPPSSPRYLAIERGRTDPLIVLIGWVAPVSNPGERRAIESALCALGGEGGRLHHELVRSGKAERVRPWVEARDGALFAGFEVEGRGRTSAKTLELAVLEAVTAIASDSGSRVAGDDEKSVALTPSLLSAVRRWLAPHSRAVVELHAKDAPQPSGPRPPKRHVVASGDTLTHIARRHGLDLDALVKLNGVDPDKPIHPGDELRLSEKGARRPKLYVVQKGDTLAKVARRFGVSKKALLEVNRLDSGPIKKGQKLVLPR